MTSESTTNDHLHNELKRIRETAASLQREIAVMLAKVAPERDQLRKRPRASFDTEIAAALASDMIDANGVDISEGGFGCSSSVPLRFTFRFEHDGVLREEDCDLIWARPSDKGETQMGFRFVRDGE